jgi:citrate lyase subunit beta/citryl-CoA lyase
MIPRSLLFVPGDAPAKMEKALASGADAIILDLEDSVAQANKASAQANVAAFLRAHARPRSPALWVRINPLSTPQAQADLEAVVPEAPDGIVLPKSEGGGSVGSLSAMLDASGYREIQILPIATETPAALFTLGTYGDRSARLMGLSWGAEDLSAAIGAVTARDEAGLLTTPYQLARALCLAGAAAANVVAIETVYPDFRDIAGLQAYAERGRRDGFVGMMAIHPAQVPVLNAVFTSGDADIAFARRVVEAS